ncbi:uncharacterized protein LOC113468018 [Diaphorina citri]|uniref:Uncharacterized protein LOC113468018 n=1 Tax=Diaphorina citri TaxID=121845 RepID=A0A3Q0IVX7_DIACI|nr:uncharacterized protein LOC113468018 [Diaphorina citri]
MKLVTLSALLCVCTRVKPSWSQVVNFQDDGIQRQIVSLFSDVFHTLNIQNLLVETCFSGDDDFIDAALKDKFISREFQIFSSLDYLENSRYSRDGLLLDVACPHVKKFLHQCSKKHLFTSKNFYLLINSTAMKLNTHAITRNTTTFLVENENLHKKMTNYLNELACLLDCRLVYTVLYYHRPKYNIRFKFYEIYRVKVKQEFHSYLLMFGSNIYKDWMPPYRRHFHGARLKTASVVSDVSLLYQ